MLWSKRSKISYTKTSWHHSDNVQFSRAYQANCSPICTAVLFIDWLMMPRILVRILYKYFSKAPQQNLPRICFIISIIVDRVVLRYFRRYLLNSRLIQELFLWFKLLWLFRHRVSNTIYECNIDQLAKKGLWECSETQTPSKLGRDAKRKESFKEK